MRRRSWLFTPATRPERFARAAEAGADVLILDLEDAVAPCDKAAARRNVVEFLASPRETPVGRALRVNALSTAHGLEDCLALLSSTGRPDYLILPKVESAAEVEIVARLFAGDAAPPTTLPIIPIIESARAIAAVETIACSLPRPVALLFGAADASADLGADPSWEPLLYARSRVVAAAALAGIEAIDSPFFSIDDAEGLRREVAASVRLGFTGKAAIHPKQVALVNEALTPSPDEVDLARRVLSESAKGVGVVDGRMIDEAIARRARRILARAGE